MHNQMTADEGHARHETARFLAILGFTAALIAIVLVNVATHRPAIVPDPTVTQAVPEDWHGNVRRSGGGN